MQNVQPPTDDERASLWNRMRFQVTGPGDAPDPATRPKRIDPRRDFEAWQSVCGIIGESRANALHEGGWSFHQTSDPRLGGIGDPRMAGPADALLGLFGEVAKGATEAAGAGGQQVARETIGAAGEAARGEIPKVAAAVKTELPGVVGAAGDAARPVARDVAGEAGEAAGKGAARGAAEGAKGPAKPLLALFGVLGTLVVVGYAATRKDKKKS